MSFSENETYRRIHFAVMAIESGAHKLGIPGKEMHDRALNLFYSSNTYQQLSDPKFGLHLMSDGYIIEDLIKELRQSQ